MLLLHETPENVLESNVLRNVPGVSMDEKFSIRTLHDENWYEKLIRSHFQLKRQPISKGDKNTYR